MRVHLNTIQMQLHEMKRISTDIFILIVAEVKLLKHRHGQKEHKPSRARPAGDYAERKLLVSRAIARAISRSSVERRYLAFTHPKALKDETSYANSFHIPDPR